jgi:large subunit ribosomal protein L28
VFYNGRDPFVAQCDYCGKSKQFGQHIRHKHSIGWALRAPHKKRVFNPNVQKTKIMVDGVMKSVHICTRCLRTLQKV